jgi:nucleotide-binding universal stress UspA family protein
MYKDILLAVDLGHIKSQGKAVNTAVEYAQKFGATLHLVTVVPDYHMALVGSFFPPDFEKKALEKARDDLHAWSAETIPSDVTTQHIIGHGSISREILEAARQIGCDLIVMASHRPDFEDHLIGPNAVKVVSHADCSVLVVR